MVKTLGGLTAVALLFAFTPGPAAAEQQAPNRGIHPSGIHQNVTTEEFSSRHRRWHRRHYVRRYWRPQPRVYWGSPYYAYGYPYYHRRYHRYYAPGPHVRIGPGGFGFSFGW